MAANLVAGMAIEERVRARLRQARFERGLSLAQLAERAGMTASTISRLETGARRLTLMQVERLAAALEVSTDALLAEQRVPDPAQDGRTWWPVGPERADGPRVYRIVLPVEDPSVISTKGTSGCTSSTARSGCSSARPTACSGPATRPRSPPGSRTPSPPSIVRRRYS